MHWHDDGEDIKREIPNRVLLAWVSLFLKSHLRVLLLVALPLMFISILLQLQLPRILKSIIDLNVNGGSLHDIFWTIARWVLYSVISLVCGYGWFVTLGRIGLSIIAELKKKLFRHVVNLDLRFYAEYPPGVLIARIESDSERLRQLFTDVSFNMLSTLFYISGVVYYMMNENRQVALTILTVIPVLMTMTFFFLRFIRKYYKVIREKWASIISYVTEYVQGVDIIQLYNYDKKAKERLHDKNLDRYRIEKASAFFEYGFWGVFMAGQVAATMIALTTIAPKILQGAMTIGTLVMFLEYIRQVFRPLIGFSEQLNFIQRALVSAERVYKILHMQTRVKDPVVPAGKPQLENEIVFDHVDFAYEGENYVLKDVSFRLGKGEKVALVGASGGGKSTVVNLLCRFYDPTAGRILLDGVDIREFNQKEWREIIGLVLQDVYLFPGTIADNLRVMDPGIPLSRVEEAAGIVRADEFISKMREGYQSELSERGANISAGERQLLSFARALTFDPPVLILDEATSSVDPHTERLIQEAIDNLLKGRTSLIVAHRLSTILNANRIIVIDQGKVAEEGSHAELLKKGGIYRYLYELQLAGITPSNGGDGV